MSRRWLLGLGAALIPARDLLAWQDSEAAQPKFSADVSVVNVLVSARDKQGKILNDLTKDDFTLDEDGHPQTIKYFVRQIDMPLTLGLLIDTSGSQLRVLDQERRASLEFFRHVMREDKDKAFAIHFDSEVELLQDLTSSRKDLEASLSGVEAAKPQLNRRNSGSSNPQGGGYPGGGGYPRNGGQRHGGTTLYDAVLLGSDELMAKQQGRKAMILMSDGVDNASKVTLTSAIEAAQRSDTLVYSIRFAGSEGPGRGGFGGPGIGMGGAEWAVTAAWDAAGIGCRRIGWMGRRSWNKYPGRPAAHTSRSLARCRSIKSTTASKRIFATNIIWAIRPARTAPDSTKSTSPLR